MGAQVIAPARGYVRWVGERRAEMGCGGCAATITLKAPPEGSTLDRWAVFEEARPHGWRFTGAYWWTCPDCCAIVAPWALDGSPSATARPRHGGQMTGAYALASTARGGQARAAQRTATRKKGTQHDSR